MGVPFCGISGGVCCAGNIGLGVRYTVVSVSAKKHNEPERRDERNHDVRRIIALVVIVAMVVGVCVPFVLAGL